MKRVKDTTNVEKQELRWLLRARREELGLSQYELAEKAGIPQSNISNIERGMFTPGNERIRRLAEALQLDPAPLILLRERGLRRESAAELVAEQRAAEALPPHTPHGRLIRAVPYLTDAEASIFAEAIGKLVANREERVGLPTPRAM